MISAARLSRGGSGAGFGNSTFGSGGGGGDVNSGSVNKSASFSPQRLDSAELRRPIDKIEMLPVSKRSCAVRSGRIEAFRLSDGLRRAVDPAPRPDVSGPNAAIIVVRVKFPTDIDTIRLTSAMEATSRNVSFTLAEQLALATLNAVSEHEVPVAVDRSLPFGATIAIEKALAARRDAAERALGAMASAAGNDDVLFQEAVNVLEHVCPLNRHEASASQNGEPPISFFLSASHLQDRLVTEDEIAVGEHPLVSSFQHQGVTDRSTLEISYDATHVHERMRRSDDREIERGLLNGSEPDASQLDDVYERAWESRSTLPRLPRAVCDPRCSLGGPHDAHGGYYTRPSKLELMRMTDDELRSVCDFAVIRAPHRVGGDVMFGGQIEWRDPVNLLNLDVASIVQIGPAHDEGDPGVDVYPAHPQNGDEAVPKPLPGEELNTRARVTLLNIFPDGDRLDERVLVEHEEFLRQLCRDNGSDFVEWRETDGAYVFDVEHFGEN
jgi:hypothetical protein